VSKEQFLPNVIGGGPTAFIPGVNARTAEPGRVEGAEMCFACVVMAERDDGCCSAGLGVAVVSVRNNTKVADRILKKTISFIDMLVLL
jgi:hypothetical protein